jgi:hypothetical protein
MHNGAALGVFAFLAGFAMLFSIIMLAIFVLGMVAMWKICVKAGRPGWHGIVPFFNCWVLMEIVGLPGPVGLVFLAPFLLSFIPFLGPLLSLGVIGFSCYTGFRLSKVFGTDQVGTVLLCIPFIHIIGLLMLAFGPKEYLGAEAAN